MMQKSSLSRSGFSGEENLLHPHQIQYLQRLEDATQALHVTAHVATGRCGLSMSRSSSRNDSGPTSLALVSSSHRRRRNVTWLTTGIDSSTSSPLRSAATARPRDCSARRRWSAESAGAVRPQVHRF